MVSKFQCLLNLHWACIVCSKVLGSISGNICFDLVFYVFAQEIIPTWIQGSFTDIFNPESSLLKTSSRKCDIWFELILDVIIEYICFHPVSFTFFDEDFLLTDTFESSAGYIWS